MAYYFFDSSALVKYYVSETGTQWARGIIDAQPLNSLCMTLLLIYSAHGIRMGSEQGSAQSCTARRVIPGSRNRL